MNIKASRQKEIKMLVTVAFKLKRTFALLRDVVGARYDREIAKPTELNHFMPVNRVQWSRQDNKFHSVGVSVKLLINQMPFIRMKTKWV